MNFGSVFQLRRRCLLENLLGPAALETTLRSVAKTLLYRAVITVLLMAITLYFTGNIGESTGISVTFAILGTLVYYVHERLWDNIKWGREGNDA